MKYNDYRDTMTHQSSPRPKRKNTAAKEQEARFQAKLKKNKGNKVDAMVAASGRNTTTKKKKARFGVGDEYVIDGKRNIDIKQLQQTKMTGPEYMREWKRTGKRPTKPLDGTHTDASKGSKAAMNRSRASIKAGTAQSRVNIPPKPKAGDYNNKRRLYLQALSKWNNKYGELAEKRKNRRAGKKPIRAGGQLADAKDTVKNRTTQRAKRMAGSIAGPIAAASGVGAARTILAGLTGRGGVRQAIKRAEQAFKRGEITKGNLKDMINDINKGKPGTQYYRPKKKPNGSRAAKKYLGIS